QHDCTERGNDNDRQVDEHHEHRSIQRRHFVHPQCGPVADDRELVVAEPAHAEEPGDEQREDEQRRVAGGQDHRDERTARPPPASTSAAPAVADSFASRNTPASANAEMSASPADSPSSPSTILKALVMPTSQTTDSGYASHPMVIVCPNR